MKDRTPTPAESAEVRRAACLDHGVHVVEEWQHVCLDCGTQFDPVTGDVLYPA